MRSSSSVTTLRVAATLALLGFAAATGVSPGTAEAAGSGPTGGVLPPAPNVLILMDRSGSMARTSLGNLPKCTEGADSRSIALATGEINMDRWGQILEGLTGHVQPFYSCDDIDRTSNAFKYEFSINNNPPPDFGYILPYNRPLSNSDTTHTNTCAISPGFLPGTAAMAGVVQGDNTLFANGWNQSTLDPNVSGGKGSIVDRMYSSVLGINATNFLNPGGVSCVFSQYNDGQLDIARKYVRFSLMTTDPDPAMTPGNGYGVTGGTVPWSNTTLTGTGTGVNTTNPFDGQWSYLPRVMPFGGGAYPKGQVPACGATAFAVGARHTSAPPWEGRHVPFPPMDGPDDANLDQIQRVLLATRPYGASPLGGLMYDGADYLWRTDDFGPNASGSSADTFVKAGCRKQYMILVSDGASNLDLRPMCEAAGGNCPFPKPIDTAKSLYDGAATGTFPGAATLGSRVETFVIGFSARGSGAAPVAEPAWFTAFSPSPSTCSQAVAAAGGPTAFSTQCSANAKPAGSMTESCCALNDVALAGSGGLSGNPLPTGAFFVESEAEFSVAFGQILGTISASQTSRATPTYSSTFASQVSAPAGGNANASFLATLNPQPGGLWSGDITRRRNICNGGTPQTVVPAATNDDKLEAAMKPYAANRFFLTVLPAANAGVYEPRVSLRPYDQTHGDSLTRVSSQTYTRVNEVEINGASYTVAPGTIPPDVMGVKNTTCGAINIGAIPTLPTTLPGLTAANDVNAANDCANAIWGFASGFAGYMTLNGHGDYNLRCSATSPNSARGCHPLGGIYHSQPVVMPPPPGFLSDEGYRSFAATYKSRPSVLYVETMDGILHAFDATNDMAGGPYPNELFSFIPPAVLPTLQYNFPAGTATLLDSSPVVKDVVFERAAGLNGSNAANLWHTMLISGEPGGYFAMEVSDPVIGSPAPGTELAPGTTYGPYTAPGGAGAAAASGFTALPLATTATAQGTFEPGGYGGPAARYTGPHFLWQLTTADAATAGEVGPSAGFSSRATARVQTALFGATPAKPAITTLLFRDTGVSAIREVGVAILPGGMPNNIATPTATCARKGGVTATPVTDLASTAYVPRTKVRAWDGCTTTTPVAGRSVTIVRLDNGEIIQAFGRNSTGTPQDLPSRIKAKVLNVPLDSPMVGTPVVYPNDVGAVAQRFYIGDADGTVWRFDVSSVDPVNWNGRIFFDTQSSPNIDPNVANPGLDGQPIVLEPLVTQDTQGRAVLVVATGDQDSLLRPKVAAGNTAAPDNYIASLTEIPDSTAGTTSYMRAQLNWVYGFDAAVRTTRHPGERVTGPMALFNNTVYFASYWPPDETNTGTSCTSGTASLWGFDYVTAATVPNKPSVTYSPGIPLDPISGVAVSYIPGVSIQAGLQCATGSPAASGYGSYTSLSFSSGTPTFSLAAMTSTGASIGGTNAGAAALPAITSPSVSRIDSWAAVVE